MKKILNILILVAVLMSTSLMMTSCSKDRFDDGADEPVITEGYVRHVILWTLRPDLSADERLEVIGYAETSLKRFEKEIPGIVKADVIYANRLESSNCDFMFDMYFKNQKALEDFSVNPEHLSVVEKLKPYIAGRTCLDVEL